MVTKPKPTNERDMRIQRYQERLDRAIATVREKAALAVDTQAEADAVRKEYDMSCRLAVGRSDVWHEDQQARLADFEHAAQEADRAQTTAEMSVADLRGWIEHERRMKQKESS